MGRLKDALWMEVWRYLQSMPYGRTLLTALNSPITGPQGIRNTWSELQANPKLEGLKKKTGLQAVLQERSDLFRFTTTEKGHLLIELTEFGRSRSLSEGLPPAPGGIGGANGTIQGLFSADFDLALAAATAALEEEAADSAATVSETIVPAVPAGLVSGTLPAGIVGGGSAFVAAPAALLATATVGGVTPSFAGVAPDGIAPADLGGSFALGQDALAQPPISVDPDGPAARRQRVANYAMGWRATKGKGKGYHDLIWTPAVQVAREAEKKKESEMARALFNAMENYGGQSVTLSQIGSDFKVAQLKKENLFKNIRLLDILRQYEDVFELIPDTAAGGWVVKLQPGAQAALPDAEAMLEQELRESLALPDRIENPGGPKEKMQALRIELLHALSRRGNRVPLQELGQEPRVQQKKQGLHQAKKLVDFIRLFPMNFRVVAEDCQMLVETASTNVSDQSMIDHSIFRNSQAMSQFSSKGGKGKGRGRPLVSPYPPPLVPPAVIGQQVLHFTPPPEAQTRGFSPQLDAATLAAYMQSGAVQASAGLFQQPAVRPM